MARPFDALPKIRDATSNQEFRYTVRDVIARSGSKPARTSQFSNDGVGAPSFSPYRPLNFHPFDMRAEATKFFIDQFVATIDMVDAVDFGLTFRL